MEEDEATAAANSELRYITLELMKLASRKKRRFREIASDFVRNVYNLKRLIGQSPAAEKTGKKHARAAGRKAP